MNNNKHYVLLNWHEGQLEKFNFIEEAVDSLIIAMTEEELGKLWDSQDTLVEMLSDMDEEEIQFNDDYDYILEGASNMRKRIMDVFGD